MSTIEPNSYLWSILLHREVHYVKYQGRVTIISELLNSKGRKYSSDVCHDFVAFPCEETPYHRNVVNVDSTLQFSQRHLVLLEL